MDLSKMDFYRMDGNVAVIEVNNPPVNAMSVRARRALQAALKRAATDPACHCVVLCGAGATFIGGADIREFQDGSARLEPDILALCDQMEAIEKPVVAAVQGYALGGGLELAIAAHYRVAHPNARFGFPEVLLGILPGAGGTQRFPRITGMRVAMDLITTGRHIRVEEARSIGLLDKVCHGNFMTEVMAFARSVADHPVGKRRSSERTVPDAQKAEQFYSAALKRIESRQRGQKAPLYCLKAIMAAVVSPYSEGVKTEKRYSDMLHRSPEAKALQYAFFSQRAAPKWHLPGGASSHTVSPRKIKTAAVIGAGTMGTGIAMAILNAGIRVTLVEQNQKLLDRGVAAIRTFYEGSVRRGKMTHGQLKATLTRLSPSLQYEDVRNTDIVVECVFEDMAIKKQVFATLDRICQPDTILCSNTSSLNIDEMASVTRRPGQVMGMHFFVPPNIMTALENVKGAATDPRTVATVMTLGRKIGKIPVLVGNCPGFVANRVGMKYIYECMLLIEEGALPHQVDQVMEDFGMAMGAFKTLDLSGVDILVKVTLAQLKVRGHTADRRTREVAGERFSPIPIRLVEAGRLGRKTGRGWYNYGTPGANVPQPDGAVTDLILEYCRETGIERRQISSQEILDRAIFCLINEGFKVLEEGIAAKPSDIDVLMLLGYGWPRHNGGPMFHASQLGLRHVLQKVEFYHSKHPKTSCWRPANLLKRLAEADVPMSDWMNFVSPSLTSKM